MPKRASTEGSEPSVSPNKKPKLSNRVIDSARNANESITASQILSHRLNLKDADVYYLPDFAPLEKLKDWHDKLLMLETWHHPQLKLYGKEFKQSRAIASYANDAMELKYSGAKIEMNSEYPEVLLEIQEFVEEQLGVTFNQQVLLVWGLFS